MCEPVRLFLRSRALPLAIAELGRLLRSSATPGSAAPECEGNQEWRCSSSTVACSGLQPPNSAFVSEFSREFIWNTTQCAVIKIFQIIGLNMFSDH